MSHIVTIRPTGVQPAKELVVISGKGGTGKTSLVASFAALSRRSALADCDVDAADLHLILEPSVIRRNPFTGGKCARIKPGHCIACGKCGEVCRFGAVFFDRSGNGMTEKTFRIDPVACEGCGVCAWFCAEDAIEFAPVANGEWFISETRFGPMVHAKLGIAQENSGKLVSTVRSNATRIAGEHGLNLVIIDGSPGIGCPVIASITGSDLVLVVTEPTLSGLHDLKRVADLTRHFGIPALVCVNKWDLNPKLSEQIESWSAEHGLSLAGNVRYDRAVTEAQVQRKSIVEYQEDGGARDVRAVWATIEARLNSHGTPSQGMTDAEGRR